MDSAFHSWGGGGAVSVKLNFGIKSTIWQYFIFASSVLFCKEIHRGLLQSVKLYLGEH